LEHQKIGKIRVARHTTGCLSNQTALLRQYSLVVSKAHQLQTRQNKLIQLLADVTVAHQYKDLNERGKIHAYHQTILQQEPGAVLHNVDISCRESNSEA